MSYSHLISRRTVLRTASTGFGYLALAGLAAEQARKESRAATIGANTAPHFTPRAKRVVFLYMRGGPCQMETFDYKPR